MVKLSACRKVAPSSILIIRWKSSKYYRGVCFRRKCYNKENGVLNHLNVMKYVFIAQRGVR